MIWRWRYYFGASILVAGLLLKRGAPPLAVLAGLAGVAVFMRRRASRLN